MKHTQRFHILCSVVDHPPFVSALGNWRFPSAHAPNKIPGWVVPGDQPWESESGKHASPLLHTHNLGQGPEDIKGRGSASQCVLQRWAASRWGSSELCPSDPPVIKTLRRSIAAPWLCPHRGLKVERGQHASKPLRRPSNMGRDALMLCGKGSRHSQGKVGLLTVCRKWWRGLNQTHLLLSTGGLYNYRPDIAAWNVSFLFRLGLVITKFIWELKILIKHRLDVMWRV